MGGHRCAVLARHGAKLPRWQTNRGGSVNDIERFMGKVQKSSSCWIWTGYRDKKMGYGMFWLDGTMRLSHRVSYGLFRGPIGDKHVCHTCDTPGCVNPEHLWLGTNAQNIADKVSKGRQTRMQGEKHPSARITEDVVRWIRTCDFSGAEIGRRLGMDRSTINYIRSGRLWGHVK